MSTNNFYHYRADLPHADTAGIFSITTEGTRLRVQNENVNCLYNNLTAATFDHFYNEYEKRLNPDFSPLIIGAQAYMLTEKEQQYLTQKLITSWIYFYAVNNLPIAVSPDDFRDSNAIDHIIWLLDKKFGLRGKDTEISLQLGAHILRGEKEQYRRMVRGRRLYYDR